ncbi:MAG: hypothetical protein HOV77_22340 [Hamadaea sp.]|uniref:DUF6232 family protein n=1 Tax=Hamadaea sp. TaxID=2024425 RepID=UPI0017989B6F|nr:DUF6232 family protein [Hamadaea sp.]NUT21922.1 hypothetical protein [Hamadaea sp.]
MQPTRRAQELSLPGIRVTDRWFVVGQRKFDVTELQNLRTVRGSHHPMAVRAAICALLAVAGIGVFIDRLEPIGLAGLAVAAILLGAAAVAAAWRNPRSYEMWAEYRGLSVQLYYCDNERRYNAVSRAVIRARERAYLADSPVADQYPSAATQAAWFTQAA